MREKLKNKKGKDDFTKNADSGQYLIINDLIELIQKMPHVRNYSSKFFTRYQVANIEDYRGQVKEMIKYSRVTSAGLIQNGNYQNAMIIDLFIKITLILSEKLLLCTLTDVSIKK
jgi:hypothetical protein